MIYKDLCFPKQKFTMKEEVIEFIAPILFEKGFVTQEFKSELLKRELKYPTGFDLEYIGVAIPHADNQYVNKDAIWVMTFEKTCQWNNVEDNSPLKISIVFGLLFSEAHKHLDMLQTLTNLFGQQDMMNKISKSSTQGELELVINEIFTKE